MKRLTNKGVTPLTLGTLEVQDYDEGSYTSSENNKYNRVAFGTRASQENKPALNKQFTKTVQAWD
jgi:hypothetical protein